MRDVTPTVILLASLWLSGCTEETNEASLAIPEGRQIESISTTKSNSFDDSSRQTKVITDRDRIAKIAEFLAAHNHDWYPPAETFPLYAYSIELKSGQYSPVVLIGKDWIGGTTARGTNELKHMDKNDMHKLRELLGIPEDR